MCKSHLSPWFPTAHGNWRDFDCVLSKLLQEAAYLGDRHLVKLLLFYPTLQGEKMICKS